MGYAGVFPLSERSSLLVEYMGKGFEGICILCCPFATFSPLSVSLRDFRTRWDVKRKMAFLMAYYYCHSNLYSVVYSEQRGAW